LKTIYISITSIPLPLYIGGYYAQGTCGTYVSIVHGT
jgi:hypothetical protein